MEIVYLICAVAGGTVLGLQFLLLLVGGGGGEASPDVDVDLPGDAHAELDGDSVVDDPSGAAFKVISTKTLVAFVTFFGIGGRAGLFYGLGTISSLAVATVCGAVALLLVAWIWSLLYQLQSSGNLDVRRVVGQVGRVYLRIPACGGGYGKVTVSVQGRTVELRASTTEDQAIPTGSQALIVDLIGPGTVSVVREG